VRRRVTANFLKALLLVAFLAALAGGLGWLIGGQRSAALFAFCALSAAIALTAGCWCAPANWIWKPP